MVINNPLQITGKMAFLLCFHVVCSCISNCVPNLSVCLKSMDFSVQLNRSTIPLYSGWHGVVFSIVIPNLEQTSNIRCDRRFVSLCDSTASGTPQNGITSLVSHSTILPVFCSIGCKGCLTCLSPPVTIAHWGQDLQNVTASVYMASQ